MSLNYLDALLLIAVAAAAGFAAGWQLRDRSARSRPQGTPVSPPIHPPLNPPLNPPVSAPTAARVTPSAHTDAAGPVVTRTCEPRPLPLPPAPPPPAADLLLVDDSAVARAKLRKLFEAAGYQVHLASDGVEALALLDKGHYRLMITDLEMPNMDGITLIHHCKTRPQTARMPMLAITGHERLSAKFNECRDIAGIHRKPWIDDILLSHVAALVGVRPTRTQVGAPAPVTEQPA